MSQREFAPELTDLQRDILEMFVDAAGMRGLSRATRGPRMVPRELSELTATPIERAAAHDRRVLDDVGPDHWPALRLEAERHARQAAQEHAAQRRRPRRRRRPKGQRVPKVQRRLFEVDGQRNTISGWSRARGMLQSTVSARMRQRGWTLERAIATPLQGPGPSGRPVELAGERDTLFGWTKRVGVVSDRTVRARIKQGWSLEAALKTPGKPPNQRAAKLTDDQRAIIRQRYAAGGVTQRVLAEEYGVTPGCIAQTIRKRTP